MNERPSDAQRALVERVTAELAPFLRDLVTRWASLLRGDVLGQVATTLGLPGVPHAVEAAAPRRSRAPGGRPPRFERVAAVALVAGDVVYLDGDDTGPLGPALRVADVTIVGARIVMTAAGAAAPVELAGGVPIWRVRRRRDAGRR